jgi:O-antigen ligase
MTARSSKAIFRNDTVQPVISFLGGCAVAVVVSLVLYGLKPVLVYLALVMFVVLVPSFFVRDVSLYWLGVFLVALQFDFKKNLVDGLEVLDRLQIDYLQFVFTLEIRMSDLPLLVLLIFWAQKVGFQGKELIVPRHGRFALAFLGWAFVSSLKAPHFYLGIIEVIRQCKYFLIFLYAANNIESKKAVKLIFVILASSLVLQGAVTLARYEFRYFEPLESLIGVETRIDSKYREDALSIDTEWETGFGFTEARRAFGTFPTPAATSKYCLLVFPIALMLCLANPLFAHRWVFGLIVILGLLTFYFSFSRTSMVACIAQIGLFYWYSLRRDYISKHIAIYLLCVIALAAVFVSPTLYGFMNSRYDAVLVRLRQYEVTKEMILANPVLGVGINNSTGTKKEMTDDSFFVRDPLRRSGDQPIHSFYLTVLAETGFVGFLCYMGFFALTFRHSLALSCSARDKEVGFASTILLICFAGLGIGVLTDPLFEDYVHTVLWLYAGMVVALQKLDQQDAGSPLVNPIRAMPSSDPSGRPSVARHANRIVRDGQFT